MKKIVLSIAASFVSLFISAQVTQSASDTIVLERMSRETQQYTLHAKEEVQTQYSITTSAGEELELDYPCRVYYVSYMEDTNISRYLIVKESNGNLLEVNTKNTAQPDDLATWRAMKVIDIPVTDYSPGPGCDWNFNNIKEDSVYIVNSQEELLSFITCTGGNTPPVIDFSRYSLLLAHGNTMYGRISSIANRLIQLSSNQYKINSEIEIEDTADVQQWHVAIIVPKMTQNSIITLNIDYIGAQILILKVDCLTNAFIGGKELVFPKNSAAFTITREEGSSGIVGYMKLFYKEIKGLLFHATGIWMGPDEIVFPENLLPFIQFDTITSNDYVLPQNGFENALYEDILLLYPDYIDERDYEPIWASVQSLVKVREYLQSNPNQKVRFFLYIVSELGEDPTECYWFVYLKK